MPADLRTWRLMRYLLPTVKPAVWDALGAVIYVRMVAINQQTQQATQQRTVEQASLQAFDISISAAAESPK